MEVRIYNPVNVLNTSGCPAYCIRSATVEMKIKHKSINLTHCSLCIYLATIYSTLDSKENLDCINISAFDEVKTAKLGTRLCALSIPSGIL